MKMRFFTLLTVLCLAGATLAAPKTKITDIKKALAAAKAQNKLLFLEMGRPNCENCEVLHKMIAKNEVQIPDSRYVYADVDADDRSTVHAFSRQFNVSGEELPFVVVASPDGTLLASHTGAGTAADYQKMLKTAERALKK